MRVLLIIILITTSSCKFLVGVKTPAEVSQKSVAKWYNKYLGTYNENCFYAGEGSYIKAIQDHSIDTSSSNYLQPLQIVVMDNNFKLITNIINCNVGGFPKLKWNRVGSFNQIPITQNGFSISKADYTITFFEQITNQPFAKQKYKYYYFVIWSSMFTHNTKRFLKQVAMNKELDKNNEILVTFINIDNEYH